MFAVAIICYLSQTINTLNMNYKLLGFFFVRLTHEKLMMYSCILKEASCCQCLRFTLGDRQGLSQSQIFSVIREPTSVSLFRRARMRRVLLFVFLPSPYHHRLPPTC